MSFGGHFGFRAANGPKGPPKNVKMIVLAISFNYICKKSHWQELRKKSHHIRGCAIPMKPTQSLIQ